EHLLQELDRRRDVLRVELEQDVVAATLCSAAEDLFADVAAKELLQLVGPFAGADGWWLCPAQLTGRTLAAAVAIELIQGQPRSLYGRGEALSLAAEDEPPAVLRGDHVLLQARTSGSSARTASRPAWSASAQRASCSGGASRRRSRRADSVGSRPLRKRW